MATMLENLATNLGIAVKEISKCPHPDKKRYRTEHMARLWARRRGLNFYKCRCGLYHLTSYGLEPTCPICGTEIDKYHSCGCYEDLMYGRD